MIPYAYSISDYDDHRVFPALEAAVQYVKSRGWAAWTFYETADTITAHHADGTETSADLSPFIISNEVDEVDVATYIDKLREDARERDRASDEAARKEGRKPILVTGSAPIYMLDRQHLIDRELRQRRYSWKS